MTEQDAITAINAHRQVITHQAEKIMQLENSVSLLRNALENAQGQAAQRGEMLTELQAKLALLKAPATPEALAADVPAGPANG